MLRQALKQNDSSYANFGEDASARVILAGITAQTGLSLSAEDSPEFNNREINREFVNAFQDKYKQAGNPLNNIGTATERIKSIATSVSDVARKPQGQVTKQEINAGLRRIRETFAAGDLSQQEALNLNSFALTLLFRGQTENLFTPEEVIGTREFFKAAVASMAFSGGGNTNIKPPTSSTGPILSGTTGSRTAFSKSNGEADSATIPGLKNQLQQKNLDNIATSDLRLAAATKGSGTTNPNFSIGTGSADEANRLGLAWVGDGARLTSNQKQCPGCLQSFDGTRIYRPPQPKKSSFATTGIQANFVQQTPTGTVLSNGHLNITK